MAEGLELREATREKDQLIEAVLRVLRLDKSFGKIEEKNLKKILRKLDKEDLTYLANAFDSLYEYLMENYPVERRRET